MVCRPQTYCNPLSYLWCLLRYPRSGLFRYHPSRTSYPWKSSIFWIKYSYCASSLLVATTSGPTLVNLGALTTPVIGTLAPIHIGLLIIGLFAVSSKYKDRRISTIVSLYSEYKTTPSRPTWLLQLLRNLYFYLFNPLRSSLGILYFLLRNWFGMVPYFAWTFFIRLAIYVVVGTYLLSSQAPKGRLRDRFLNFGPIFLFPLSLCYDWGYLPFVILLPPVLQFTGLPTSF